MDNRQLIQPPCHLLATMCDHFSLICAAYRCNTNKENGVKATPTNRWRRDWRHPIEMKNPIHDREESQFAAPCANLLYNRNVWTVGLPQGPWLNVLASCTYSQPTRRLLRVWMKSENRCFARDIFLKKCRSWVQALAEWAELLRWDWRHVACIN